LNNPAHRPLRIGLTGGIASGKSAVASEFAKLGVPVIDADQLAREAVKPGEPALEQLVQHFGPDILNEQSELNRAAMRQRIFNDPGAKQAIEAILHPAVRARQQVLSDSLGGAYQIHVMPLLAETHSAHLYDRVLVVDCPREIQKSRLLTRDGIGVELAEQILNTQADRTIRLQLANDVIDNQGPLSDLQAKVVALHAKYLQLAEHSRT
jgi:dephospho-CoA kinase